MMPEPSTRRPFQTFCAQAVESTWLLAVALVPVAVNQFADAPYEFPKVYVLRALAVVVVGLLAVGRLVNTDTHARLRREPVALAAMAVVVTTALGAAVSLTPSISLLGDPDRAQGLLTSLAYATIGLAVATGLRSAAQARRLAAAIVLGGSLAAAIGVLQRLGLDPLLVAQNVSRRAPSTLGNSIFLSAYASGALLVAIAGAVAATGRRERAGWMIGASLAGAGVAAGASRGPKLGLAAGLAVFFWLLVAERLAAWLQQRWSVQRVRAGLLLGLVVAAIALGAGAVAIRGQVLDRNLRRSRTIWVRLDAWEAASRVMLAPSATAEALDSDLASWRILLGYGPEAAVYPLALHTAPDLADLASEEDTLDRAHNLPWQRLLETGSAGILALLALWFLTVREGLVRFGLGDVKLARGAAGAAVGLLAPWLLWRSLAWSGVGAVAGMLAPLAWASLAPLADGTAPTRPARDPERALVAGFVAAVACHILETLVGIGVTPTLLLFWVCAGALISPWARRSPPPDSENPGSWHLVAGLTGAVLLATLARLPFAGLAEEQARYVLAASCGVVAVIVGLFAAAAGDSTARAGRQLLVAVGFSLAGATTGFAASRVAASAYAASPLESMTLLALPAGLGAAACLAVTLGAAARTAWPGASGRERAWIAATSLTSVLTAAAILGPTITATRAGGGNSELRAERPRAAIVLLEDAVASSPLNPRRDLALARALRAAGMQPTTVGDADLLAAQATLESALEQAPLDTALLRELGAVFALRALRGGDDPVALLDSAVANLERAWRLRPSSEGIRSALQTAIALRADLRQRD